MILVMKFGNVWTYLIVITQKTNCIGLWMYEAHNNVRFKIMGRWKIIKKKLSKSKVKSLHTVVWYVEFAILPKECN